ncbi:hypothetical protein XELAEV_18014832mg [Xenopus laevis]|uniref:GIY-YIG domain-containing protein n=1 Tax=Xenopus laevis TaxID=8355 RepID=A0A974DHG3_XENLA|nr:hypothetical protein XELAEV_18014832mg [Xenopus laevis]
MSVGAALGSEGKGYNDYNLRFTNELNTSSINFLDVTLCIEDNSVVTTIYRKPCSINTILNAHSCHPKHITDNIPYSQFLSIRRICKKDNDLFNKSNDLYIKLLQRGYEKSLLDRALKRAARANRNNRFQEHHNTWLQSRGCFKCGASRCITCKYLEKTLEFTSSSTKNKKCTIRHYMNCDTKNLVYVLTCKKCQKQYVGQTGRKLNDRIREHVSSITKENCVTPVAKHFAECNNRDVSYLSVIAIDKITLNIRGGNVTSDLLRKEAKWIFHLGTKQPLGLNYDFDISCFI